MPKTDILIKEDLALTPKTEKEPSVRPFDDESLSSDSSTSSVEELSRPSYLNHNQNVKQEPVTSENDKPSCSDLHESKTVDDSVISSHPNSIDTDANASPQNWCVSEQEDNSLCLFENPPLATDNSTCITEGETGGAHKQELNSKPKLCTVADFWEPMQKTEIVIRNLLSIASHLVNTQGNPLVNSKHQVKTGITLVETGTPG